MASLKILIFLVLTLQCLITKSYCAEEQTVADYDSFDLILSQRVASSSTENFLLSPLAVKLALTFLTETATGGTKLELSSVLGSDPDRLVARRKFTTTIEAIQTQSPHYDINLGSKIYVEDTAPLRMRFIAIASEYYKTDLTPINFQDSMNAAGSINVWAGNSTQGRIKNLVKPDDLSNISTMITNTMIFKGSWLHQFDPKETKIEVFYCTPTLRKSVPFMYMKEKLYYAESTKFDAKILRVPYLGNKYAIYIIVPNSLTGLDVAFNGFYALGPEMDSLHERQVKVALPKFQFSYKTELTEILKQLGLRQSFSELASFPGIARGQALQRRLHISRVLQGSGIGVNEFGSAADSTGRSQVNEQVEHGDRSEEFTANRPFFFFIQDESTRQLLFTGRVSDPSNVN